MLEGEYKIDDDGWSVIGSHYVNLKTGKTVAMSEEDEETDGDSQARQDLLPDDTCNSRREGGEL